MREIGSQIVGVRMAPQLARDVKAEAATRGITVRKLFEELWECYVNKQSTKS